jgi:Flp pilus assembly protein CpaB
VTHRRRGLLFAASSVGAALIAASVVARHETRGLEGDGLRPVLVARLALAPGSPIGVGDVEVRQFPAGFVPDNVLTSPEQAMGERTVAEVPPGAYLLPTLIGPDERGRRQRPRVLGANLTPVEIRVVGAGALRRSAGGGRVDVLVTRDSPRGLGGHTEVAVEGASLLALGRDGSPPGEWTATLAVARDDALRLIEAESYAREVRLIDAAR